MLLLANDLYCSDLAPVLWGLTVLPCWLLLLYWILFGVRHYVERRTDALRSEIASLRAVLIAKGILPPPEVRAYPDAWRIRRELFPS